MQPPTFFPPHSDSDSAAADPGPGPIALSSPRWFLAVFAACLTAAFIAIAPALRGDFIWDDKDIYVQNNPFLLQPDGLYKFWFTTEPIDYYPLAYSFFWFEHRLWDFNTTGYHVLNVFVHALAGTFLAWTLKGLRFPAPVLVALLFTLHPINVESVAWIAQLKTCLAGMLAFAAAGCIVRGWWWTAFVCFFFSLASKPIAIAFPVAILLYAWWRDGRIALPLKTMIVNALVLGVVVTLFRWTWTNHGKLVPVVCLVALFLYIGAHLLIALNRFLRGRSTPQHVLTQSLPFFATSVVFGLIGIYFQQVNVIGAADVRMGPPLTRLIGCTWAVWFYAWKSLVPVNYMFVYPRWNVEAAGGLKYLPGVALVAIAVFLWTMRRRWGRTPLAIYALYLLLILPSSGLADAYYFRYTLVGDHYAYQAVPVVIAAAVGGLYRLLRWWAARRPGNEPWALARIAAAAALIFGAVQCVRLAKDYKNDLVSWNAALRRNPDAWLAHNNLASLLVDLGEMDKAERHVNQLLRLRPDLGETYNTRGLLLSRQGRHEEAVASFREAAELSPYESLMWENLGNELFRLGRNEESLAMLQKAVEICDQTRWVGPMNVRPRCELGHQLAVMGRIDEAFATFTEAEKLRPNEPFVALGRGHLYAMQGKYQEAADQYRKALELAPNQKNALYNLGQMQERLGDLSAAFASFREASDRSTEAFISVVWMKAASPKPEIRDPKQALEDIEQTQPVGIFAAMIFDASAVAYAANGRFGKAVESNDRALAACRESPAKDLPKIKDSITRLIHRGELYRRSQPYLGPTYEMTPVLDRE